MNAKRLKNIKEWVRNFQRKLYLSSKKSETRRYGILYDKIYRKEVLEEAWKRVRAKRGTSGVDGQSIEYIEEEIGENKFLEGIEKELKEETYKANVIKRVYIPKDNGKERPLGIPIVKDRVIQMAVKLIIEPLFESWFCECSYGFRPCRSNSQAVNLVHKYSNSHKWIVDVDLKSYFDTIPHERLMALIRRRIGDKRILAIIRQWLKAGILEKGEIYKNESGTPQGGVLSPLLSNIYLHEIDKQWEGNPSVRLVRYADDMVLLCRSERQAKYVLDKLGKQLDSLELTLNREKTRICHVSKGFTFLGFMFKEAYSYRLKRKVRIKYPSPKNMKKMRKSLKETVKGIKLGTDLREVIQIINRKIEGWVNYFKIGNSYKQALEISNYACEQLRIYWRRKKHKKRIRGTNKWKNSYFYEKELYYAPNLL